MISVIMPAYNSEEFITPAIESILNQTYRDFELIVIDDGSTDSTLAIVQRFADADDRIRIIRANHGGVGNAMNTALKETKYPWVAVMHSDDIAMPTRLEKQIQAALADPDVVIWGTDGWHINHDGNILSRFRVGPLTKEDCRERRQSGRLVQAIHPTVMINRDVALKVGGYDPAFKVCEDIDLFDRMMRYGDLVTIPEELLKYRVHGSSLSMKKYLSQAVYTRFVKARQLHRFETDEELSFEDFKKIDEKRPWTLKLREYTDNLSGMYYRRAGMAYGNRNYIKTAFYIVLASVLKPQRTIKRMWNQVISPQARRKLTQAEGM